MKSRCEPDCFYLRDLRENLYHPSLLAADESNLWQLFACRDPQVTLVVKGWLANTGDTRDMGLIHGLERCPAGGHGNPLQYPYPENPKHIGAGRVIPHRVAKSWT